MMMQMSIKAGIKKIGIKGNDTLMKELRQLHYIKAMVLKKNLTDKDKKKVLRYLLFIEEKQYGTVTERQCIDGRPQWQYTHKEDASSPTV